MLPALLLAGLILALSIPGTSCESATLRFLGQTDFIVNETSTSVVRLVVEKLGDPINVTALVLVGLVYHLCFIVVTFFFPGNPAAFHAIILSLFRYTVSPSYESFRTCET